MIGVGSLLEVNMRIDKTVMIVGGIVLSAVAAALAVFIVNYEPDFGTADWILGLLSMTTIFAPMLLAAGLTVTVIGLAIVTKSEDSVAAVSAIPEPDVPQPEPTDE